MYVLAHRPVNLHSASKKGIVHVPAGKTVQVPDDVVDHPGFRPLRRSGYISVVVKPPQPTRQSVLARRTDIKALPAGEDDLGPGKSDPNIPSVLKPKNQVDFDPADESEPSDEQEYVPQVEELEED
jgi:hypothetical protein